VPGGYKQDATKIAEISGNKPAGFEIMVLNIRDLKSVIIGMPAASCQLPASQYFTKRSLTLQKQCKEL